MKDRAAISQIGLASNRDIEDDADDAPQLWEEFQMPAKLSRYLGPRAACLL